MDVHSQRFILKPTIPVVIEAYYVEPKQGCYLVGANITVDSFDRPMWVVIEGGCPVYYSVGDFSRKYCRESAYINGVWT